jgi:RNA polymerase sigma-70 factor (ECF subfamily)
MGGGVSRKRTEDGATVHAVRAGDESAFGGLVERHRRELRVHCYRMLGSFEDSEDMVQETFLRAWRGREGFEGRSTIRAWLYRIATNVCLDYLDRQPRSRRATNVSNGVPPPAAIPWLQPFPDGLLEPIHLVKTSPTHSSSGRRPSSWPFWRPYSVFRPGSGRSLSFATCSAGPRKTRRSSWNRAWPR